METWPKIVKILPVTGGYVVCLIHDEGPLAGQEVFRSPEIYSSPTGTEGYPPELVKYVENGLKNGFSLGVD